MQPDSAAVERAAARQLVAHPETPIEQVIRVFREWLYLPDPGALEVLLGAVAANHQDADPVWLLMVGPPGCGKTELLQSISALPKVHPVGTLTEAALLSGTPGKDRAQDSKGGLLRVIGASGLILCKDFTSILSMHRDTRASLLAALREVYDGAWTRHVGVDGGRTMHWSGRIALIAGVTPVVDSHHAVMSAMGDRFILFRLADSEPKQHTQRAMWHAGQERQMRRELAGAVKSLFESVNLPGVTMPEDQLQDALIALAVLAARGRSAVERDGYSREVELIPDSEVPTRLAIGLARLHGGMRAIGVAPSEAWRLTAKAGLDSIPAVRRAALAVLLNATAPMETPEVANSVRYPTNTARRALEDLTAHKLANRTPGGQGKADLWVASLEARELYLVVKEGTTKKPDAEATVPDLSLYTYQKTEEDFSGTLPGLTRGVA